jgi:AcrR family transcriptional regulator
VGTLYQYFPNKSALLQAALRRHMNSVMQAVEDACSRQHGNTLREMATAFITAFFQAKMRDVKTSVALYSVSSDVDGARIVQQMSARSDKAIAAMFASSRTPITRDPHLVANMLQSAISGVSRRLLESPDPEKHFDSMFQELLVFVCAYLDACSGTNESSSWAEHAGCSPAAAAPDISTIKI